MTQLLAAWRRTGPDDEGHSIARLEQRGNTWWSMGEEVLRRSDGPIGCRFEVELGLDWIPRVIVAQAVGRDGSRTLDLRRDRDGRWFRSGDEAAELLGCLDVDLAATPLTNTYPIRRNAGLAVNESRTAPVAWVEVPSLRVLRVDQTYRRLGPSGEEPGVEAWEYGDPKHGAFRLTVDRDGLVVSYEGFAERIA